MLGTEVRELLGDQVLEAIEVRHTRSGARRVFKARSLFVFIGVTPCTGWLGGLVDLDAGGFVRTGNDASAAGAAAGDGTCWRRSALETSQPGIFAVGDVRSGPARRVAAAVGEGAMAIRLALERARTAQAATTISCADGQTARHAVGGYPCNRCTKGAARCQ